MDFKEEGRKLKITDATISQGRIYSVWKKWMCIVFTSLDDKGKDIEGVATTKSQFPCKGHLQEFRKEGE